MSDSDERTGISWKTVGFICGGLIATLATALVSFYVASVNKQFEAHRLAIRTMLTDSKKIKEKLDKLGIKIYGVKWVDVRAGKAAPGLPLVMMVKKFDVSGLKQDVLRLKAQVGRARSLMRAAMEQGGMGQNRIKMLRVPVKNRLLRKRRRLR